MELEVVLHCSYSCRFWLRFSSFLCSRHCPHPKFSVLVTAYLSSVTFFAPHLTLAQHLPVPSSHLIHVLLLGFLTFRNLCRLLIALDSWVRSPRAQSLRESAETQGQRP